VLPTSAVLQSAAPLQHLNYILARNVASTSPAHRATGVPEQRAMEPSVLLSAVCPGGERIVKSQKSGVIGYDLS